MFRYLKTPDIILSLVSWTGLILLAPTVCYLASQQGQGHHNNIYQSLCTYIFFYLAYSQGQGYHNSVTQLLWAHIIYPNLPILSVGGNRSTRRKPTTFNRAIESINYNLFT